ncbi:ATP-binding protein [Neobacillus sp. OS1-32]|jgi:signal transduction histidine kinase|uniref:histidine kinase n=1 Tax=Neobacillus paridis TaxID=2803862 RepID=A0ABS1TTQ7_9BACI|nr:MULTISPECIES: ATP-binding protein [Neobacillus]MBL4953651.1 GHKL domain-containing protein [Neobacillus paridis]WML28724.1 ATP-binding protein [Neobacillus sp. OS1-32]
MGDTSQSPKLIFEEKKAVKLFLTLFYLFFITYNVFWYSILPKFSIRSNHQYLKEGLGIWLYICVIGFLPVSVYIYKKKGPYFVKYFVFISYIFIDVIDNLLRYFGSSQPLASGNIVELLFVVIAPIFVNKRFFWTVSFGLIGKYCFLGVILHDMDTIVPIVIILTLVVISYILLNRFFSYIHSLTAVNEELHQKEKLAVIGQMAATIGHEIRNPLASLKGFAQLQHERYPETSDYYSIMIQEIDRLDLIVNDLMYISKSKALQIEKANIKDIISYTISIMEQQAFAQNVKIETEMEEPLPLLDCDEKQLKQVFINLLKNAIEAMPEGGTIRITAQSLGDSKIAISVEDEGCGIKSEDIPNLKVPFFTTKKGGTGLGLVITNKIIKEHHGDVNIESNVGKGTKVTVTLPRESNHHS